MQFESAGQFYIILEMDNFTNFIIMHYHAVISAFIVVLYVSMAIGTVIHILLRKEDIKSSISWIALVILSPIVGSVIYLFLGINRVKRKAVKLRKKGSILSKYTVEEIKQRFVDVPVHTKQFMVYGYSVYPQSFAYGNGVKPLQNGTEAYPEMIEAIKNAKKEVLVESYIFDSDRETDKFIDAFKQAIKNGASVKVLVDGIGTLRFFTRSIERKLGAVKGLEYGVFLPPQIPISLPFVNLRNHRKIMIIDGQIAFFGGMNLSEQNVLVNDKKNGVIDITFRVEGPVIDHLAQIFEDDWEFTTGKHMHSCSKDMPDVEKGNISARVIPDGPDSDQGKIELLVQGAINTATKKITIVTPYFLPESNILTALEMAAMKGVPVEIIIPEVSDHKIMSWAEKPNFKRLVEKGVKIYRTPPPFDHSKIFIVDEEWSFVGSANWDVRSFKLLFESNMELLSKEFAQELSAIVDKKKKTARTVTLKEINALSLFKRIRNNAFRLLTPYY